MAANVSIGHVSMHAKDPKRLAEFYQELLGLESTMSGDIPPLGEFIFLGRRADEDLPLIALHTREDAKHFALEVGTLSELKAIYAGAKSHGIAVSFAMNHRVALSMYFHDPEGNVVEVFWPTGQSCDEPYADLIDPVNLERPETELLELVSALA